MGIISRAGCLSGQVTAMLVAVLAFGTVGDVRPLLALSIELCERLKNCQVRIITHEAHQEWAEVPSCDGRLKPFWIRTLPARIWNGVQDSKRRIDDDTKNAGGTVSVVRQGGSWQDDDRHREDCIAACESALQLCLQEEQGAIALQSSHPSVSPFRSRPTTPAETLAEQSAPSAGQQRLIIFNLFALEGFHIAEALGVPCVAASPCLVPYPPPNSFEKVFRREEPQLYCRLKEAAESLPAGPGSASDGDECVGEVSWREVSHWIWPLFSERWGAWRYHRLGLPPLPYATVDPTHPLPPPPLLLYGISPCVVARPGYWPPSTSVHLSGAWHSPRTFPPAQRHLPAQLASLLAPHQLGSMPAGQQEGQTGSAMPIERAVSGRPVQAGAEVAPGGAPTWQRSGPRSSDTPPPLAPVCCDCGSMGAMGLIPCPARLLRVLNLAAQQAQRPFILVAGAWPALVEEWDRLLLSSGTHCSLDRHADAATERCTPWRSGAEEVHRGATAGAAAEAAALTPGVPVGKAESEVAGEPIAGQARGSLPGQHCKAERGTASGVGSPLPPPFPAHRPLPWLEVLRAPLSHDLLLPGCAALLHHGGAGTVAAALRCGVPQIICPLHFDQHYWAERVSWNGWGVCIPMDCVFPPPSPPVSPPRGSVCEEGHWCSKGEGRSAAAIVGALEQIMRQGGGIRESCKDIKAATAEEQGTTSAVQKIEQYLAQYNLWRDRSRHAAATANEDHLQGSGEEGAGHGGKGERGMAAGDGGKEGRVCPEAAEHLRAGTARAHPVQRLTLPNGLTVRCLAPAETLHIYREIWEQRCYLQAGITLPVGGTVLDVGSNIGLFAMHLLLWPHKQQQGQQQQEGQQQQQQQEQGQQQCSMNPLDLGAGVMEEQLSLRQVEVDAGGIVCDSWQKEGRGAARGSRDRDSLQASLRVWAFEPVPGIAAVLRDNLRDHGLQDQVHVVEKALHAHPGPLELTYYPRMPGNSTAKPREKWRHQRPDMAAGARETAFRGAYGVCCEATTLAAFVAEHGLKEINLLKIDVEGSELDVLQGMDSLCWSITKQIVLEVHDVEERVLAVQSLLQKYTFRVTVCSHPDVPSNFLLLGIKSA